METKLLSVHLAQLSKVDNMRDHGLKHGTVFVIDNIILATNLSYVLVNHRVVNMTNPREQMMLYLEVQSAQKPVQKFAFRTEI